MKREGRQTAGDCSEARRPQPSRRRHTGEGTAARPRPCGRPQHRAHVTEPTWPRAQPPHLPAPCDWGRGHEMTPPSVPRSSGPTAPPHRACARIRTGRFTHPKWRPQWMWTPPAEPTAAPARSASKWRKWGPAGALLRLPEEQGGLGPAWCQRAGRRRGRLPAPFTEPGARFRTGAVGGAVRGLRGVLACVLANGWGGPPHVQRELANQRARLLGAGAGAPTGPYRPGAALAGPPPPVPLWRSRPDGPRLLHTQSLWAARVGEQLWSASAPPSPPAAVAQPPGLPHVLPKILSANGCGWRLFSFLFKSSHNNVLVSKCPYAALALPPLSKQPQYRFPVQCHQFVSWVTVMVRGSSARCNEAGLDCVGL